MSAQVMDTGSVWQVPAWGHLPSLQCLGQAAQTGEGKKAQKKARCKEYFLK